MLKLAETKGVNYVCFDLVLNRALHMTVTYIVMRHRTIRSCLISEWSNPNLMFFSASLAAISALA